RMGETGDPWGSPQCRGSSPEVYPPCVMVTNLELINSMTQSTTLGGHPCSVRICRRRYLRTASKAPWTSKVIIVAQDFSSRATSTSCAREAAMSTADLCGSAPATWGWTIFSVTARKASFLAISLSMPLLRVGIREIGLQPASVDLFLFGLGIKTMAACRHASG
ncbi:hypothetical protein F5X68DRAFT_145739, partial [Plectosphaerella plurivora]